MSKSETNENKGKEIRFSNLSNLVAKIDQGYDTFISSSLIGEDLSKLNLDKLSLKNIKFEDCLTSSKTFNVSETSFDNCEFIRCTLKNPNFNTENRLSLDITFIECKLIGMSLKGYYSNALTIKGGELHGFTLYDVQIEKLQVLLSIADFRVSISNSRIDLVRFDSIKARWYLNNTEINEGAFIKCEFQKESKINTTNFSRTQFKSCVFSNVQFTSVGFLLTNQGQKLAPSDWSHCNMNKCAFDNVMLGIEINGETFSECSFSNIQFNQPKFRGVNLESMSFQKGQLSYSQFKACKLQKCDFSLSTLKNSQFDSCDLIKTDFSGCIMNSQTIFHECEVMDMKIDKYSLASIEKSSDGVFTMGNLIDMDIRDDLTTLRTTFSGAFLWVHLIALMAWLAPYVTYTLWLSWNSQPVAEFENDNFSYVFIELINFIRTGSESGVNTDWLKLLLFVTLGVYNLNRFALLFITKKYEMKHSSSGIPVKFSLSRNPFKTMWSLAYYGFILNLFLVVINTILFLFRGVPI